jgi:hypothetical protein
LTLISGRKPATGVITHPAHPPIVDAETNGKTKGMSPEARKRLVSGRKTAIGGAGFGADPPDAPMTKMD